MCGAWHTWLARQHAARYRERVKGNMIVIVEGNIAAGKSTIVQYLQKKGGYRVFLEPTVTNPYLVDFYANPSAFAMPLQLWLLRMRFITYLSAVRYLCEAELAGRQDEVVLMDRSIFSDAVFAEQVWRDKFMTDGQYRYYQDLRRSMMDALPVPHMCLHVDVDAKVCHGRVASRARVRACLLLRVDRSAFVPSLPLLYHE